MRESYGCDEDLPASSDVAVGTDQIWFQRKNDYLVVLQQFFDEQDHVLRALLPRLRNELNSALEAAL